MSTKNATASAPNSSWTTRHRGPYRFNVNRPGKKAGFTANEWLSGEMAADEVESDAAALLDDPRDTILSVDVWSVRESQFVMTFSQVAR